MKLYALFCADPLKPRGIEPEYADEALAARQAGFTPVPVDHDWLDRQVDPAAALRHARFDGPGCALYRGWMLRADAYAALYAALAERGIRLLTAPSDYSACHHGPENYAALAEFLPETCWLDRSRIDDPDALLALLRPFGKRAVIVKDWVKSQAAGYWREACFIPDASDPDLVLRIATRFRELQGESLTGGLLFKAWIPLLPRQGPPGEYRAFILKGRVLGCWPRSPAAREFGDPPLALLQQVAARIPGVFASADFGRDGEGRWWLLEVGDGQVSALPTAAAAPLVFAAVKDVMVGAEQQL